MTPTIARLRLITGDPDDLASLRVWLTGEEELRGNVLVERNSPDGVRTGTVGDVLVVALGAGGAVTALARAVPTWLRSHPEVTIEVREPNGRTVTVSAKGAVDAQEVIQSVLAPTPR
ncbi:effector-associated constant component EACC1 [Actinophytocola oryzae]|uniref:Uncharacterized protein n=1 Tax=Actinophytocola oryzae TaxID=502181 RepID=A0A4R7W5Y6_9PSEU|nr:hypothetical protein [Actinophytocola oryzae]TDV57685.1 hypothetical protein CLV71_101558 [Actinophytocola oryzae]